MLDGAQAEYFIKSEYSYKEIQQYIIHVDNYYWGRKDYKNVSDVVQIWAAFWMVVTFLCGGGSFAMFHFTHP